MASGSASGLASGLAIALASEAADDPATNAGREHRRSRNSSPGANVAADVYRGFVRDPSARSLTYRATADAVEIDGDLVGWLVEQSALIGRQTARLCLHSSVDDAFHQMVIVQYLGYYHRPHRHLNKAESLHVVEGQVAFLTFDDAGAVAMASVLGPGRSLIARCGPSQWHSVVPMTPRTIYHETKAGRYLGDRDSIFARWAPAADDAAASDYAQWLVAEIARLTGAEPDEQ